MLDFLYFLGNVAFVIVLIAAFSLPVAAVALLMYALLIRRPLHWISLRSTLRYQKKSAVFPSEGELAKQNCQCRQSLTYWLGIIGILACCLFAMLSVSRWQGDMATEDAVVVLFLLCVAVFGVGIAKCCVEQSENRIEFRTGRVQRTDSLSGTIRGRKKVAVYIVDSNGDVFRLVVSRAKYERNNRKGRSRCFALRMTHRLIGLKKKEPAWRYLFY